MTSWGEEPTFQTTLMMPTPVMIVSSEILLAAAPDALRCGALGEPLARGVAFASGCCAEGDAAGVLGADGTVVADPTGVAVADTLFTLNTSTGSASLRGGGAGFGGG